MYFSIKQFQCKFSFSNINSVNKTIIYSAKIDKQKEKKLQKIGMMTAMCVYIYVCVKKYVEINLRFIQQLHGWWQ